jgi:signal transduction histidine kinase
MKRRNKNDEAPAVGISGWPADPLGHRRWVHGERSDWHGFGAAGDANRVAAPDHPELSIGDLAQQLLPPLQAVRLGVALVQRDAPRAPEIVKKIDATVQAMECIVDELLHISRAPGGGLLPRASIGLAGICRSVIADASIRHPGRTIVLKAHDEACGNWDGERLRKVVRNLLANALQHGAQDAKVVLSVIDLGDRALLTVVNRGEPIPAELREHLFDPFRRGAGLGLYVVKAIVEAHHGSVEVDSDRVRTVFGVTLPKHFEESGGVR